MECFNKILFIDDDALAVKIYARLMQISNFCKNVIPCTNGREAIAYLEQNINDTPEIIFVDINMHVMGGWDFLEWYQNWCVTTNIEIPVYVISSSLSQEDSAKAKTFSVVKGFISKPITVANLKSISIVKEEIKSV